MPAGLPFCLDDYLALVDWTGKIIRDDKRGAISSTLPPILERLDIEQEKWLTLTTQFESRFKALIGHETALRHGASALGYQRTPGLSNCQVMLC